MEETTVVQPFFQVGVLVEDLEAARDELSAALGLKWSGIVERESGDWRIRVCFSQQGPPYLELIEGPPGSPWEVSDGPRIDHIGYWTDGIGTNKHSLEAAGVPIEFDGTRAGGVFTYHRGRKSGLRVELLDASGQPAFYDRWGLTDPSA